MFDALDPAFRTVTSHPRLGPPALTEHGVVFLDDLRITFGCYDAEARDLLGPPHDRLGYLRARAVLYTLARGTTRVAATFSFFPELFWLFFPELF
jgi:hypothetical protein